MSLDLTWLAALVTPPPISFPNKWAKKGLQTKLKNQVLPCCSAGYRTSEKARSSCQIFMQTLFLFYFKFNFDQKGGGGGAEISLETTIHYSELPAAFSCSFAKVGVRCSDETHCSN